MAGDVSKVYMLDLDGLQLAFGGSISDLSDGWEIVDERGMRYEMDYC